MNIPADSLTWRNTRLVCYQDAEREIVALFHEVATWRTTRSGRYKPGWPASRDITYELVEVPRDGTARVLCSFTGRLLGLRRALREHCPGSPVLAELDARARRNQPAAIAAAV